MPSANYYQTLNASESADPHLFLLRLTHDDFAAITAGDSEISVVNSSLHFVNNTENITSNGIVHLAYPFEFQPPKSGETDGVATIKISNVDRRIASAVRQISSPIVVTIQAILASQPDIIEQEWDCFHLSHVSWDQLSLTGHLTGLNDDDEFVNEHTFNAFTSPALF